MIKTNDIDNIAEMSYIFYLNKSSQNKLDIGYGKGLWGISKLLWKEVFKIGYEAANSYIGEHVKDSKSKR